MIPLSRVMQRSSLHYNVIFVYFYVIIAAGSIFTYFYLFQSPKLEDVCLGEKHSRHWK